MDDTITVKLDIGQDLRMAIAVLIKSVDDENSRLSDDRAILSPGGEVKKAFGIDLTDIIKHSISLKMNTSQ